MTKYKQKRIEKRLCLDIVNKIEDITGVMFHEYLPELSA